GAHGETITTADLKRMRPRILATLDAGFFRARYVRASPNERKLMRNIAMFGENATIEQLQQASGKRNNELQPTISALIAKGLVYRPERARIGFTAPMFGAFLQRTLD
ncbi:MAG TPA: ATP-binding protein, partial [Candidatus Dormibacteraeota bacterium]